MQSITFACLPIDPQTNSSCNTVRELSSKSGKQNIGPENHSDDSFLSTHFKRVIQKSYVDFNLQKTKIKELYNQLKHSVEPQRQKLLNRLVQNQKELSSLKQTAKKYQFKNLELKTLFNKLKSQKERQQKILSNLIEQNIEFLTLIEQNNVKKFTLEKAIDQLREKHEQKAIETAERQKQFQKDFQKFQLQLKKLNFSKDPKQKQEKYSTENDLEVQTVKNFAQNASIHSQELRNCLSSRFQHLIKLKESKNERETQLINMCTENIMLEDKISFLERELKKTEQKTKESIENAAHEEFKLNSIQMENIELKARLQILRHSLNDQISQSKQNKQLMKNQLKFIDDAQISSEHTSKCLSKLIGLRIESEYLQTRIKSSI